MSNLRVVVVGGGAAGFFAAIACAEKNPTAAVTLYEATAHPLAKVRISGGGRCNVTHACFEPRERDQERSVPQPACSRFSATKAASVRTHWKIDSFWSGSPWNVTP